MPSTSTLPVPQMNAGAFRGDGFPYLRPWNGGGVGMPDVFPVEAQHFLRGRVMRFSGRSAVQSAHDLAHPGRKFCPCRILRFRMRTVQIRQKGQFRQQGKAESFAPAGQYGDIVRQQFGFIGRSAGNAAQNHAQTMQSPSLQSFDREQRMIDAAQFVPHRQQHGKFQRSHEVEHVFLLIEGDIYAPCAFNQREGGLRSFLSAGTGQFRHRQRGSCITGGQMRRTCGKKTAQGGGSAFRVPKMQAPQRLLPAQSVRGQKLSLLAGKTAGLYGFDCPCIRTLFQQRTQQRACGYGFARVRVRTGDEAAAQSVHTFDPAGLEARRPSADSMALSSSKARPAVVR